MDWRTIREGVVAGKGIRLWRSLIASLMVIAIWAPVAWAETIPINGRQVDIYGTGSNGKAIIFLHGGGAQIFHLFGP